MTHSAGSRRGAGKEPKAARREGEREGPDPRQKSPEHAGTAGKAGEHTGRNKQNTGKTDDESERQAGGRQRQAKAGNEARRTGEPNDRQTTTTRRRASERTEARQERQKQTQPTALKIISALPDCSTMLYCCQANLVVRARSASSACEAQERTKATVSSAGRPPASKTSGTSSPPEGG